MGPLLYLTFCALRNRLRMRLKRLKEPRYLIGLFVGIGYFWTMFGRSRPRGLPRAAAAAINADSLPIEMFAALLLFLFCAMAWIPGRRKKATLIFTQADVQFLFTAPFTRRQLINYKLMSTQIGALVGSAFMTVVFRPFGLSSHWMFPAGILLTMTILNLHLMGISLSRESLGSHGLSGWLRQWLPIALLIAALTIVTAAIARDWPRLSSLPLFGAATEFTRLASTGAAGAVLWPFRAVVRLPLAATQAEFLGRLPLALLMVVLNYVWVIRSDARFEEASAELAEKIAGIREGKRFTPKIRSSNTTPFTLAHTGRAETAILWKNLIMVGRYLSLRTLLRILPLFVFVTVLARVWGARFTTGGLSALFLVLFILTNLLGPQLARNDLRQDLVNLVVIKTWPVDGATLVRGEVLAPAALLTTISWLAVLGNVIFTNGVALKGEWAIAAALLSPGVILLQLLAQNALAVIWPSWVVTGNTRPRGIDVMGQRLLMLFGLLLVLAVAVLPAAIAGGMVEFAIYTVTRSHSIIVAAVTSAFVLLAEAFLVSEAIGKVLDRTDVSAIDAQG